LAHLPGKAFEIACLLFARIPNSFPVKLSACFGDNAAPKSPDTPQALRITEGRASIMHIGGICYLRMPL